MKTREDELNMNKVESEPVTMLTFSYNIFLLIIIIIILLLSFLLLSNNKDDIIFLYLNN